MTEIETQHYQEPVKYQSEEYIIQLEELDSEDLEYTSSDHMLWILYNASWLSS